MIVIDVVNKAVLEECQPSVSVSNIWLSMVHPVEI